jgi:hypothetical protein
MMIMMYTCKVCETRSARQISKQGYYHGSVIVRCPGCKGLHMISDHLGWFDQGVKDVEEVLRERGEAVRRGTISQGPDGNVVEMTAEDLVVLRSASKSVRLKDGEELPVVPAGTQKDGEKE